MKERYHVTFSSWDYDLSSCIQELFKEMELAKRKRPVMDVLFQFLSKRVQLDFVIFSEFGVGWCVVAAVDGVDALKYISSAGCLMESIMDTAMDTAL